MYAVVYRDTRQGDELEEEVCTLYALDSDSQSESEVELERHGESDSAG